MFKSSKLWLSNTICQQFHAGVLIDNFRRSSKKKHSDESKNKVDVMSFHHDKELIKMDCH